MQLTPETEVIASIISYSLCSGSLVLVNKLILYFLPFPSIVITIQLFASIFLIYGANLFGVIEIDPIKWDYLKPYMVYTVAFSLGVYTNMQCLNLANVETVIVARALSPLIVSFFDFSFLGRELPSNRSLASLCVIVLGAMGYANADDSFNKLGMVAYLWPFLYLGCITFEMVYGKKIVQSIQFKTMSGPVQYTNLLGWPPMVAFAIIGGEFTEFTEFMQSKGATTIGELIRLLPNECIALVILGCIVGTGIGYSGWWCRHKVSATSYTLIGVINKCFTVIVNLMIWDKHASPAGIAGLFLCLVGGAFYKQAPMRKSDGDIIMKAQAEKDMGQSDSDGQIDEENITKPLIKK